MTAEERTIELADGNEMPLLGLGVWQVPRTLVCERRAVGVRTRLSTHRHGPGLRERGERRSGVARERSAPRGGVRHHEVLSGPQGPHDRGGAEPGRLGIDQLDLYIVHWPRGGPTWAWRGMERARDGGHTRSIGVSNFGVGELDQVIAAGDIAPVVNQVQFSPFEYRRALLEAREQAVRAQDVASTAQQKYTALAERSDPNLIEKLKEGKPALFA